MPKSRKRKPRPVARRIQRRERLYQSPLTGDLGFSDHPWLRMEHQQLGLPYPTVMFDVTELRNTGRDPESLGMVLVKGHDGPFDVPEAAIIADMRSRYDIDLYESEVADMNHPVRIVGGVFDHPHPDHWWAEVHDTRELLLIAGDSNRLADAVECDPQQSFDMQALLLNSYIGRAKGLMVRAYPTGIGTAMPD